VVWATAAYCYCVPLVLQTLGGTAAIRSNQLKEKDRG
jgi:hypothetical protein